MRAICIASCTTVAVLTGCGGGTDDSSPADTPPSYESVELTISEADLDDKLMGYWVGQLVGNFMGLPFESQYQNSTMPVEPQTYYDKEMSDRENLTIRTDVVELQQIAQGLRELGGAWTDDDTDIEYVTSYALQEYGLELDYAQITEYWKKYINDWIWGANAEARAAMKKGILPPETGSRKNNKWWFGIDPQLEQEIWSVVYPGMLERAVARADWGARITSTDFAVHPTRFYAALYSAAFFESDINRLYDIATEYVPKDSAYHQALLDVKKFHQENPKEWRLAWPVLRKDYCGEDYTEYGDCKWSSMINGVMGALAFLYGQGDFKKTVGIAIAAGYDCDNQAATIAGLLGVIGGSSKLPRDLTHNINGSDWDAPFNNTYINDRRQPLPKHNLITDIVDRIKNSTKLAIVAEGGSIQDGVFTIQASKVLGATGSFIS